MTAAALELSIPEARRVIVAAQLLSAPRPKSILDVVRHLGSVQMDPTSAVARTEHLVLFSRLGTKYRISELERLLWSEGSLFEYRAFILPTSEFAVHRETMRTYPPSDLSRHAYVRRYLKENAVFRRYILTRLRDEGPLRTRDFEDRSAEGWRTGGWNDDQKSTGQMLETLWAKGEVMIVGRDGGERLWDLGSRRLPFDEPRIPSREFARRVIEGQLRPVGVAKLQWFGKAYDGMRPRGFDRALADLVRAGVVVPIAIQGVRGVRYAHVDSLSPRFRPRTVLLSPFDRVVYDRDRAEELFGFRYRLEIYVPKEKREFGYFVLPILHGDRLIGRIDPRYDRSTQVLRVDSVFAEEHADAGQGPAVAKAIQELARWRGAKDIALGRVPSLWRKSLRAAM